jgi:SAM-dependent methyltransferase
MLDNIFERIYSESIWGTAGDGSGEGSEPYFTHGLCMQLQQFVQMFEVQSILDAPCGSAKWVPQLLASMPNVSYTGVDISATAVRRAITNLQNVPNNVRIYKGNLVELTAEDTEWSSKSYDLVLCRDCLQHLSYSDILGVLKNLAQVDTQWYAFGSYMTHINENSNITTGNDNFLINLMYQPFNMIPDYILAELHVNTYYRKHVFLYKKQTLLRYVDKLINNKT